MRAAQHRELVDAEVDDAVRHRHVERAGLQIELFERLEIAFEEPNVRLFVTELLHVPIDMSVRRSELFVGHVDADNFATFAHELRDQIDVAARARAEVQDPAAL